LIQVSELTYAKDAVRWLLDHPDGLVDMHGLGYWAQRVDTLRAEFRASL
jgi:hypothetical protein